MVKRRKLLVVALLLASVGIAHADDPPDGWLGSAAWTNAAGFADLVWTPNQGNVTACALPWVSDWIAGVPVTGVCYDWGGKMSLADFETDMALGKTAGDHYRFTIYNRECTKGVDCSGMVCQLWGVEPVAAADIGRLYGRQVLGPSETVWPGDIHLKPLAAPDGHVRICGGWNWQGSEFAAIEAQGDEGLNKVVRTTPQPFEANYSFWRSSAFENAVDYFVESDYADGTVIWKGKPAATAVASVTIYGANEYGPIFPQYSSGHAFGADSFTFTDPPRYCVLRCLDSNGSIVSASLLEHRVTRAKSLVTTADTDSKQELSSEKSRTFFPATLSGSIGIITPARWNSGNTYLAQHYRDEMGYDVEMYLIPENWDYWHGGSLEAGQQYIQNAVQELWNRGARYIMLVGDGHISSTQYVDRVIPTYTIPCEDFIIWNDFQSDLPYADCNDDGLYDVVLSRLPVHDEDDFVDWVFWLQQYDTRPIAGSSREVFCIVDDLSPPEAPEAGRNTAYFGDLMYNLLGSNRYVYKSSESGGAGVYDIIDAMNRYRVDMLFSVAYTSSYGKLNHVIHSSSVEAVGSIPIVVAPTCETACFANGADYAFKQIAERMMFPHFFGEGATIAFIGCTSEVWTVGARAFAQSLFGEINNAPAMPMGNAFYTAIQGLKEDGFFRIGDYVERYALLGDPVAVIRHYDSEVGVNGGSSDRNRMDVSVAPNPSNARVTFTLRIGRKSSLAVKIYDIRGRCVDVLFDGTAEEGPLVLSWDGRDIYENGCASSVYVFRATDGEEITTKRFTLVK